VLEVATAAVDRARRGDGPSLVECMTYRHHGHSEHDPARYRPEEELAEWAGRDPIELFELYMEKRGLDVPALRAAAEAAAREEVERAIAFAEASPHPGGEEAMRHVYYEGEPLPDRVTHEAAEHAAIAAADFAAGLAASAAEPDLAASDQAPAPGRGPAPGELPALPQSGESRTDAITYVDAIREALAEEMERDPTVFILGEDVGALGGAFGATRGLIERFGPGRVIDTPISESLILGAAAGAAVLGLRPVAEMQFADFVSCGFDQLVNTAATFTYRHGGRARVPMVVRLPAGARIHGGLFHSQNPESFFLSTPGLSIVAPATVEDAKGLLKSALRGDDPVLYLEYKSLYRRAKAILPPGEILTPIGKALVRVAGDHLTIVTYGPTLGFCLEAAEKLRPEGVFAEVIDLRTLAPLDLETVAASVRRTSRLLIVHEDRRTGGLGAEIAARVAEELFEWLDAPVMRVTGADTHYAYAPAMEDWILPDTAKILAAARALAAA
jgi:pyruvate/2-oxoglutarate/acetoin dehydrogenase E1 component